MVMIVINGSLIIKPHKTSVFSYLLPRLVLFHPLFCARQREEKYLGQSKH